MIDVATSYPVLWHTNKDCQIRLVLYLLAVLRLRCLASEAEAEAVYRAQHFILLHLHYISARADSLDCSAQEPSQICDGPKPPLKMSARELGSHCYTGIIVSDNAGALNGDVYGDVCESNSSHAPIIIH